MRSFSIGLVIGIVGTIVTATAFIGASWLFGAGTTKTRPPLISDLPAKVDDITPAFAERIRAHFPIGSDEAALVEELRTEAFQPEWILPKNVREAAFIESDLVCRKEWHVVWNADLDGKITMINADFGAICS